jgi:inorganic pyrophosphatase
MAANLLDLDPGLNCPETVRMIVEIPRNSGNKYEYDKALGIFRLDRPLYASTHYPGDYGFVPGTKALDDDPTDILALTDEPTFPGCLLEVRPIGVLDIVDQHEPDQKILAVPDRDPRYTQVHSIDQIYAHLQREIQHFFSIYKELEGKITRVVGWRGPEEARKVILADRERYLASRQQPGERP